MIDAAKHLLHKAVQELERCGFQPLGSIVAQGSGWSAGALAADGSTWVEVDISQPGLRSSLQQLFKTGELRDAACTAQFTTEFNNHSYLVTTTSDEACAAGVELERLPPQTSIAVLVLRHMQRIEMALRDSHPLKILIHTCADEVEAARQRARARHIQTTGVTAPITVAGLRDVGVAPRWALLIAGDCAATAEALQP